LEQCGESELGIVTGILLLLNFGRISVKNMGILVLGSACQ